MLVVLPRKVVVLAAAAAHCFGLAVTASAPPAAADAAQAVRRQRVLPYCIVRHCGAEDNGLLRIVFSTNTVCSAVADLSLTTAAAAAVDTTTTPPPRPRPRPRPPLPLPGPVCDSLCPLLDYWSSLPARIPALDPSQSINVDLNLHMQRRRW